MKTSVRVYLESASKARKSEIEENFLEAAKEWRNAWRVAAPKVHINWSYARAEFCFKRAIEKELIAIKKTRELDFKQFMEE